VSTSVRMAMAALADALAEQPDRLEQAEAALRNARAEPGDQPADWALLRRLAELQLRGGNRQAAAFGCYVEAIRHATIADTEDSLVQPALELIRGPAGLECGRAVSEEAVDDLRRLAAGAPDSRLLVLVTHLLLVRGEVNEAQQVVDGHPSEHGWFSDPTLELVELASQASRLLQRGELAGAEELLFRPGLSVPGSPLRPLRAWFRYVEHDLTSALAECRTGELTSDLAIAETLTLLRALAEQGTEAATPWDVMAAATRATRLEPRAPEVLLVRAQVLLECDQDLSEGRELLARGLSRLSGGPEQFFWWVLQEHGRQDDRYRYFRLECAAAQHRAETVLELYQPDWTGLTSRQLAAMHQQVGRAYEELGRTGDAMLLLSTAADGYAETGEDAAELDCLLEQAEIQPSSPAALLAAERLWASTHDPAVLDWPDRLGKASRIAYAAGPGLAPQDAGRANILLGLLAHRRCVLSGGNPEAYWRGLPNLIIAAEVEPTEPYAQGHLATALASATLDRWAQHYARRAHALLPTDRWLQELVTACDLSWLGGFDEFLLERLEDPQLKQAYRLHVLMLAGRFEEMASIDFESVFSLRNVWERNLHAYYRFYRDGFEAVRPEFERVLAESIELGEAGVIGDLAVLVAPQVMAPQMQRAIAAGRVSEERARGFQALAELVCSDGKQGSAEFRTYLKGVTKPSLLSGFVNVDVPVLKAAHPQSARLHVELDALAELARYRLPELLEADLLSAPVPSDLGPSGPLRALVSLLLRCAAEEAAGHRREAIRTLDRIDLAMFESGGLIAERGLQAWRDRLR
jgi:hypothetical protein